MCHGALSTGQVVHLAGRGSGFTPRRLRAYGRPGDRFGAPALSARVSQLKRLLRSCGRGCVGAGTLSSSQRQLKLAGAHGPGVPSKEGRWVYQVQPSFTGARQLNAVHARLRLARVLAFSAGGMAWGCSRGGRQVIRASCEVPRIVRFWSGRGGIILLSRTGDSTTAFIAESSLRPRRAESPPNKARTTKHRRFAEANATSPGNGTFIATDVAPSSSAVSQRGAEVDERRGGEGDPVI